MPRNDKHSMLVQAPVEDWDDTGKLPVASMKMSAEELEIEYGLTFTEDVDDLGPYRWTAVVLQSGTWYAFVQHADAAIQVFADPKTAEITELARALDIPPGMIVKSKVWETTEDW